MKSENVAEISTLNSWKNNIDKTSDKLQEKINYPYDIYYYFIRPIIIDMNMNCNNCMYC